MSAWLGAGRSASTPWMERRVRLTLSDVIADVQNAVGNGEVVLIPQAPITLGGWIGAGYIILDPTSGSGAYRISGGLNGGSMASDLGNGLALIGLGAIKGAVSVIIPVAQADSGDCGQKKQEQLDWQTMLALAIVMTLVLALLLGSGGAAAPVAVATARAFAALLITFASIAIEQTTPPREVPGVPT